MVLKITENWQKLLQVDSKSINEASQQIHYAAQNIAIPGKYLLEERDDDSHTTAEWLQEHNLLAGNWIKGKKLFRIALDIMNFQLVVIDNEIKEIKAIELHKKSQAEIFEWILSSLTELGVNTTGIMPQMHYEIPENDLAHGGTYKKPTDDILLELSKYRHNAHIIFSFLSSKFKNSEPVRVWPHHFDTGTIIPVEKDNDGNVSKSIGLGLAIADNTITSEYYFYVSPWSESLKINYELLPSLTNNGKWHIQNWNGAYLAISDVFKMETEEEQVEMANGFLISAIDACLYILDSTGLFSENKSV